MKRFGILAAALLAALPATARADILWDLVHDAGSGGSYGATSKSITNDSFCGATNTLTCGTIVASSQGTNYIYGNDFLQLVGGGGDQNNGGAGSLGAYSMGALSEKGLGLCVPGSSGVPNGCDSTSPPFKEIDGDFNAGAGTGPLYLDLTGVLNSGGVNRVWISSTQLNEGWQIYASTVGSTVAGVITGASFSLVCEGTAANSAFTDISTCALDPASRYLRFNSVQHNGFAGDFAVQALRFNSVVPEPGTMGLLATGLVALTGAGFIRRRNKKS